MFGHTKVVNACNTLILSRESPPTLLHHCMFRGVLGYRDDSLTNKDANRTTH